MARSDDWIDPPSSFTVDDARPILYRADGTPLKRQIGFVMASQTGKTLPQVQTGKKSGGKKKC
jgi:hypothetical protein